MLLLTVLLGRGRVTPVGRRGRSRGAVAEPVPVGRLLGVVARVTIGRGRVRPSAGAGSALATLAALAVLGAAVGGVMLIGRVRRAVRVAGIVPR